MEGLSQAAVMRGTAYICNNVHIRYRYDKGSQINEFATHDNDLRQVSGWFIENSVEVILTKRDVSVKHASGVPSRHRTSRTSGSDPSKWGH